MLARLAISNNDMQKVIDSFTIPYWKLGITTASTMNK
jgi:hypothetical protein